MIATEKSFLSLGIIAMHGERKGNGFWLYLGSIGTGRCLLNNGKNSGNPFFWMNEDAKNLLSLMGAI